MKRNALIVIIVASVAGIATVAIFVHRHRQERKRQEIRKTADALQEYSTGSGWALPPPPEAIVQSNVVIDGGVIEISEEEYFLTLSPMERQEENRKRIERMTLVDDRQRQRNTEQSPGAYSSKTADGLPGNAQE